MNDRDDNAFGIWNLAFGCKMSDVRSQTSDVGNELTTKCQMLNAKSGITLIALIITVIILLILAGTAISIAVNGGDIFGKTNQAREGWNSAVAEEERQLKDVLQILNTMPEYAETDVSGANVPVLPEGNMEVYYLTWDASGNEVPSETEPTTEWHNYNEGKWANIKTVNGDGNEAYWVWIPRYAYKVPTKPTSSSNPGNPTIEIAFLSGTSNNPVNASDLNGGSILTDTSLGVEEENWVVHPAFNFGGTDLKGIWVAKFEASNNNSKVNVKPGVASWRSRTVDQMFNDCRTMTSSGGVLENATSADPHMMKNVEWGAVAYLTQSKYGQMRTGGNGQVWNNPNNSYLTGYAAKAENSPNAGNLTTANTDPYNEGNGPKASTTGNEYGIYDMAGGLGEYVAAYVETVAPEGTTGSAYADQNTNITTLKDASNEKYVDKYSVGTSDTQANNYNAIKNANNKITKWGDAVYETSYSRSGTTSWQNDCSRFPDASKPVFARGGSCSYGSNAGVFYFGPITGGGDGVIGFRPVFVAQ